MSSSGNRSSAQEKASAYVNQVLDELEPEEEDEFEMLTTSSMSNSAIEGWGYTTENQWYEILYISRVFPSPRYEDQKDQVLLVREFLV